MQYRCLKNDLLDVFEGYRLVAIREEDMESIRLFRNAQIDVLRQNAPISKEEQSYYYTSVIAPLFSEEFPSQVLFSFLLENAFMGYGGLTYIDWVNKRAELSFLVNPDIAANVDDYKRAFSAFLALLFPIAFRDLSLHKLVSETFDFRESTRVVLEENGFKKEGQLRDHVFKKGIYCDSIMYGLLNYEYERTSNHKSV